jgi:hypothetical protein
LEARDYTHKKPDENQYALGKPTVDENGDDHADQATRSDYDPGT